MFALARVSQQARYSVFLESANSGRTVSRVWRVFNTGSSPRNHSTHRVAGNSKANNGHQRYPSKKEPSRATLLFKSLRGKRVPHSQVNSHDPTHLILGHDASLPIRARFAPSPTGYLHLGSLRTALFANIIAHASRGGSFILRIEDTDRSRLVKDAEERIIQDLKWAGLKWDEGPDKGGRYGPYRQSERLPIYKEHVEKLIDAGHAYRCFCTSEQLEAEKRRLHNAGMPTVYPGTCRSIDTEESKRRADAGEAHVVRFKGDNFGTPVFNDAIYGHYKKKNTEEDFVILKTDGFPTYHLANVVDDHLMEITHVIRGEEWLISTPKHIALYQAFGWRPPTFAHLGLLVNPDGTKLSKRDDSVDLTTYKEQGYFPIALLSWLAHLGSAFKANSKTPRTLRDMIDVLTYKFTTGGIKHNISKLDHFQAKYREAIFAEPVPELAEPEARLIRDLLTLPMLRHIDAIMAGTASDEAQLPEPWRSSLELVPALKEKSTREAYVKRILDITMGKIETREALVQKHPYLFWRPPPALYASSVAATPPDAGSLEALEIITEEATAWLEDNKTDAPGTRTYQHLREVYKDGPVNSRGFHDRAVLHDTVRLVATGDGRGNSQTTPRIFAILGLREWRCRMTAVRAAIKAARCAAE